MVTRIWHGWTSFENADKYEAYVKEVVFKNIEAKNITGYKGMQFLRKERADEVEFISMMWFDALENVKDFVGEDYEVAHVPDECRELLKRFDERADHYEIRHQLKY